MVTSTPLIRAQAIWLCSIAAFRPRDGHPNSHGLADAMLEYGCSDDAFTLARLARLRAAESWDLYELACAEAEAMLRTGWEPSAAHKERWAWSW